MFISVSCKWYKLITLTLGGPIPHNLARALMPRQP